MTLRRRAAFSFEALLGLYGPDGFWDGFETAPRDLLARIVADAVSTLSYLLQGPLDFPEAAFDPFFYRGVHLAVEDGLAHVPDIGLGEVVPPAFQLALVFIQPVANPRKLVSEVDEPLLLVVDKVLF